MIYLLCLHAFQVGHIVTKLVANDLDSDARLRYSLDPTGLEGRTEEGRLVRSSEVELSSAFDLDANDGTLRLAKVIIILIKFKFLCVIISFHNHPIKFI